MTLSRLQQKCGIKMGEIETTVYNKEHKKCKKE